MASARKPLGMRRFSAAAVTRGRTFRISGPSMARRMRWADWTP
ncbi:MAG TPA: hypothetical protein VIS29_17675 [Streptomyces sp.]